MDPLSIATGVLSLLAASITTGNALKAFYDGASLANTKLRGLITEVDGFTEVLRSMNTTLDQKNIQLSLRATGHITDHLQNLAAAIQDGQQTLLSLKETLEKVNKSVSMLDAVRKHMRLKGAAEKIAIYQQQIRSYKNTLHLTLQTIILWNSVSIRESTELILPNLEYVHDTIRQIAEDINGQISSIQLTSESKPSSQLDSESMTEDHKLHNLKNLRNCVKSSASIVSSATTTLNVGRGRASEQISITYASDFGDCFPPEPAEPMRRWISSTSDYGYTLERSAFPSASGSGPKMRQGRGLDLVEEGTAGYLSDGSESDSELEADLVDALLRQGKDKLVARDFEAAENNFRNCLSRIGSSRSSFPLSRTLESRSEIATLLLSTYRYQDKWDAARSLLEEEIALEARVSSKDSAAALAHTLALVEVLMKRFEYKEALSLGRRALKGYRKLGPTEIYGVQNSLELLCRISKASGSFENEAAYAAILTDILHKSHSPSTVSTVMLNPDAARQSTRHVSSGSMSSIKGSFAEGLGTRHMNETVSAGGSGKKSVNQPLSPTLSMSTVRSSGLDSWTSKQTRDIPSPNTEYSYASSNLREEQSSYKDIRAGPYERENYGREESNNTTNIPDIKLPVYDRTYPSLSIVTSPTETGDELDAQQSRASFKAKLDRQIPILLGAQNVYRSTSSSQRIDPRLSDISIESEHSTTSGVSRSSSKSVPPPRPHKPKHLRHGHSNPLPTQISPKSDKDTFARKSSSMVLSDPARPPLENDRVAPYSSHELVQKGETNRRGAISQQGKMVQREEMGRKGKRKGVSRQKDSTSESDGAFYNPVNLPAQMSTQEDSGSSMEDSSAHIEEPGHRRINQDHSFTQTPAQAAVEHPREFIEQKSREEFRKTPESQNDDMVRESNQSRGIQNQHFNQPSSSAHQRSFQPMLTSPERINRVPLVSPQRRSAVELFDSGFTELDVEVPTKRANVAVDFAAFYAENDIKERRVRRLEEMGFDRTRTIKALQMHNLDLTAAANYLAGEILEDNETPRVPQVQVGTENVSEDQDSDPEDIYHDDSTRRPARRLSDPPEYRAIDTASSSGLLDPKVLPRSKSVNLTRPSTSEYLNTSIVPSPIHTLGEPERPSTRPSHSHRKKVSFGSGMTTTQSLGDSSEERPGQDSRDMPSGASEGSSPYRVAFEPNDISSNMDRDEPSSSKPTTVPIPAIQTTTVPLPTTQSTQNMSPPGALYSSLTPVIIPPSSYTTEKEVVLSPTSPGMLSPDTQWSMPDSRMNKSAHANTGLLWPAELPRRMVAICGDELCGKTSLISMFSKGVFPETYNPSPLECTKIHQETSSQIVEFVLWDLGNDMGYDFYADAHFVIICFSISDPSSLRLAQTKYAPLIKTNNSSVRYMLVGLKKDRRQHREHFLSGVPEQVVSAAEGQIAAVQMKAVSYMECSAKTGEGVVEVFDAVAGLAMMPSERITRMKSLRNLFGKTTGKKKVGS